MRIDRDKPPYAALRHDDIRSIPAIREARSVKSQRKSQLRDRKQSYDQIAMTRLRVLFLCSRNLWRSPTAERVFGASDELDVRSRGLAASARRRLTAADLTWADVVFVMEESHHDRLLDQYAREVAAKPVHVLDIPDEYRYMDPELVEILESAAGPLIAAHLAKR
jgi:predicted protein tyrosine phosphatase